jgi:hypothetical protein
MPRPSKLPDNETIRSLYWDQQLQSKEIGAMYGVTAETVVLRMKREGIPRRSVAEGTRLSFARGHGRKQRTVNAVLADVLRCPKCFWVWRRETESQVVPCPRCGEEKDCRTKKKYKPRGNRLTVLAGLNANRDHKKQYANLRKSVLLVVGRGNVVCVNCGCDRPELLEVNHINGGGGKEIRASAGKFYQQIVKLQRPVDDLNLLCKVCNALHAIELKFGKLPFEVYYGRENP